MPVDAPLTGRTRMQFVGAQQLVGERKKTCVRPKMPPKPVREEPTDPKIVVRVN